jgi:class 3 adenylate cyclase/tetratricopeptide (TPR) repeat protein
MTFEELVDKAIAMLERRGRVTYRALKRQFQLDDDVLEDLTAEIIKAQRLAVDEDGEVLVWTGTVAGAGSSPAPAHEPVRAPHTYTPPHLAEKILTSKAALEGERKQVTVLFADLKSSMELLADRDPEEARQLLDPVLECMMAAVHRYEGTVNQVMDDGIMALFGAPIAHEDHAVRACYAALAMQEAIHSYSDEVRRGHGVEMQIRVGLNSGEVVVRAIGNDLHMDYSAIGQTTHLAARMEQLAPPGSIRLTAETLRLAEGWVQLTPLGPVPVKGLPVPVEVYELMGAGPARTRLQAFAARGLTPFVGRQTELAALHQALEQAGAGHGQVIAVIGEPAVGKTRLFHKFTHASRTQGWLRLESNSTSYSKATPYLPVIDLLKAYFQIDDRDDARRIREKLTGRLLTLDPALGPTLPAFLALLEVPIEDPHWQALDPSQRRQRTLDALKRLLLRESQVQPLLLVFENLHWIDTETQAFLDGLVESLPAVASRALLAESHAELGMFAEGRIQGEEGLRIAEAVAHPASRMIASWGIGLLALRYGDLPRALPLLERAMGICQEADLPFYFPWMAAALGAAYTLSGRVADAVPLLTQALEQTIATEMVVYQAFCSLPLGEAQLLAGRLEEAHALAERTLTLAREHQERGHQAYALRLLGEIAARREPPESDQAGDYYRQALTLAEELGMRPLMAHCHLGLGKLYVTIRRHTEARAVLSAAIELYRAMEMTFWLPQAEAVLAAMEG